MRFRDRLRSDKEDEMVILSICVTQIAVHKKSVEKAKSTEKLDTKFELKLFENWKVLSKNDKNRWKINRNLTGLKYY